jgi:RNA polymerase sigma-70 factor (ECF subfamily)
MKLSDDEFEKLALEQLDMVDRMARTMAGDSAEADDLVQETYLNAWRGRQSFDLQSFGIRPWLLRILHNLFVSRRLREARQPLVMESEQLEAAEEALEAPLPASVDLGEMDEEVEAALGQLPVELRAVLVLWAVDELSYREIAEVCGVPIGTVMSRLHRARRRLAGLLSEHAKKRGIVRE